MVTQRRDRLGGQEKRVAIYWESWAGRTVIAVGTSREHLLAQVHTVVTGSPVPPSSSAWKKFLQDGNTFIIAYPLDDARVSWGRSIQSPTPEELVAVAIQDLNKIVYGNFAAVGRNDNSVQETHERRNPLMVNKRNRN